MLFVLGARRACRKGPASIVECRCGTSSTTLAAIEQRHFQ